MSAPPRGGYKGRARAAEIEAGLACARRWRDSRRAETIAAAFCPPAFHPCAGFPFRGHRTVAQVWADEGRG